jgi:hypothetical protein
VIVLYGVTALKKLEIEKVKDTLRNLMERSFTCCKSLLVFTNLLFVLHPPPPLHAAIAHPARTTA